MRLRYRFRIVGYVVMPEHFHLLMSEPEIGTPSTVMQAIKLGLVRRVFPCPSFGKVGDSKDPTSRAKNAREMGHPPREMGHPGVSNHFWQRRFYDFNLWSQRKEVEKLRYMHRNPVERGLVERPEDWRWSSFRAYACGETGPVRVGDWALWEQRIRSRVS